MTSGDGQEDKVLNS